MADKLLAPGSQHHAYYCTQRLLQFVQAIYHSCCCLAHLILRLQAAVLRAAQNLYACLAGWAWYGGQQGEAYCDDCRPPLPCKGSEQGPPAEVGVGMNQRDYHHSGPLSVAVQLYLHAVTNHHDACRYGLVLMHPLRMSLLAGSCAAE
jgi:hypothetical protein